MDGHSTLPVIYMRTAPIDPRRNLDDLRGSKTYAVAKIPIKCWKPSRPVLATLGLPREEAKKISRSK